MYFYTKDLIKKKLHKLGLKKGDSIFVTTSLGMIGNPKDFKKKDLNQVFLNILLDIVKKQGTVFVPTYSYSFSSQNKSRIFDIKKTKAKIGSFPNFFLKQKGVFRNNDPFVSIAGKGYYAQKILSKKVFTSYGNGCVFDQFNQIKNFKILNIGLGPNWTPFIHYADFLIKVDHRFEKIYEGYIKYKDNKSIKTAWVYNSRVLLNETKANAYKVGYKALKKKIWNFEDIGRSRIYIANYKKYFDFVIKELKKNKWALSNGPKIDLIKEERKKIKNLNISFKKFEIYNDKLDGFGENSKKLLDKISKKIKIIHKTAKTGSIFFDYLVPERKTFYSKSKYIETFDYLNFGVKESKNSNKIIIFHLNTFPNLEMFFFVKNCNQIIDSLKNIEILFIFHQVSFAQYISEKSENIRNKKYYHIFFSNKDFYNLENVDIKKINKKKDNLEYKSLIKKKILIDGNYPFYKKKLKSLRLNQEFFIIKKIKTVSKQIYEIINSY